MDAATAAGFLFNGILLGAILALAGIGLTLVYGILRLANFAHGDMVAAGAFLALYFGTDHEARGHAPMFALATAGLLLAWIAIDRVRFHRLQLSEAWTLAATAFLLAVLGVVAARQHAAGTTDTSLLLATLLSIVATCLASAGLELVLWRPLRRRRATLLTLIIVSIGLSLVVRNSLQLHFSGSLRSLERPTPVSDVLLGVRVSPQQQFVLLASLLILASVHLFLRYTWTGKAMRAVSDDPDLARVTGINVDRIVLYVWLISGALAAVAGVFLTLSINNNSLHVSMGAYYLLPIFAAVIVGGIGSPYGAIVGGFLVGIAMKTSFLWLGRTDYELAIALGILVVALIVRPQGILGARTR